MTRSLASLRSISLVTLASLFAGGCIVGFKVTDSDSSSESQSASGESMSAGSMSGGSMSGGSMSGTESASGTDSGTSSGSTSASGSSGSSGSSGGTTDMSGTDSGTTGVTSTSSSSTTSMETGGVISECLVDADCKLFSDCCTCEGYPPGGEPPGCDAACDVNKCEAIGVAKAVCRFGTCATERVKCDDSEVVCDAPVPNCGPSALPVVTPDGTCYTGECAAPTLCDTVPDCTYCLIPDWTCVSKSAFVTTKACEPIPAVCEGTVSCECGAASLCDDVFSECAETPGGVTCSCPDC